MSFYGNECLSSADTQKSFHNEILTLYAFDFTIKHKSIDHKRRRTKSIRKAEKEKIMKQVILTGDRPTGRLHVGHYVGSLKERVRLQNSGKFDEIYIMIADAQALTDNAEHPEKVRQNIMQVALDYLACGLDPEKVNIFIQSMVPELTELSFYYMNLVTVARVQRNPTVKAEIKQKNFEASIPVGFSHIRSVRQQISLHLEQRSYQQEKIRCQW